MLFSFLILLLFCFLSGVQYIISIFSLLFSLSNLSASFIISRLSFFSCFISILLRFSFSSSSSGFSSFISSVILLFIDICFSYNSSGSFSSVSFSILISLFSLFSLRFLFKSFISSELFISSGSLVLEFSKLILLSLLLSNLSTFSAFSGILLSPSMSFISSLLIFASLISVLLLMLLLILILIFISSFSSLFFSSDFFSDCLLLKSLFLIKWFFGEKILGVGDEVVNPLVLLLISLKLWISSSSLLKCLFKFSYKLALTNLVTFLFIFSFGFNLGLMKTFFEIFIFPFLFFSCFGLFLLSIVIIWLFEKRFLLYSSSSKNIFVLLLFIFIVFFI